MNNCVFCKIANNEIKKDFIYENDNFISFKDLNQDIIGHSLVVSKNHYNTILDSPDNIGVDLIDCIKNTTIKLMKENKFSGFNIIKTFKKKNYADYSWER